LFRLAVRLAVFGYYFVTLGSCEFIFNDVNIHHHPAPCRYERFEIFGIVKGRYFVTVHTVTAFRALRSRYAACLHAAEW